MIRRTPADWLNLVNEYQTSGLSQAEFCRAKGIDPKYFSKRKAELRPSAMASPFVAVRREAPTPMTVEILYQASQVTVSGCSPVWLGQLLRELA